MHKSKNFIIGLITIIELFVILTSSTFAQAFEGKVKLKLSADDESTIIDYYLKGEMIRIEMGENSESVFINDGKRSIILMNEDKMYMDLDNSIFSKIQGMMGNNEDDEAEEEYDVNTIFTGKTKEILGYNCEQMIVKDEEEGTEIEGWFTDELGNFMVMKSPMGETFSPSWGSKMSDKGFFPLLVITKDEDGEVVTKFEAIEVDKQSVSDEMFAPPSDFEEMKMQIPGF